MLYIFSTYWYIRIDSLPQKRTQRVSQLANVRTSEGRCQLRTRPPQESSGGWNIHECVQKSGTELATYEKKIERWDDRYVIKKESIFLIHFSFLFCPFLFYFFNDVVVPEISIHLSVSSWAARPLLNRCLEPIDFPIQSNQLALYSPPPPVRIDKFIYHWQLDYKTDSLSSH